MAYSTIPSSANKIWDSVRKRGTFMEDNLLNHILELNVNKAPGRNNISIKCSKFGTNHQDPTHYIQKLYKSELFSKGMKNGQCYSIT